MSVRKGAGDLVYVGDVHLDTEDGHLNDFLAFLEELAGSASRLVLMGDLFNVWVGQRSLERPHQLAVVQKLTELRGRGVVVRYVEGNRDFRLAPAYVGSALDEAALAGVAESFAGHRIWAIHGDLANVADRQYRIWRRVSRSAPFWLLFNLLPQRRRLRLADSLERGMRRSNPDFKHEFPEAQVRSYAQRFVEQGYDTVVLGHFHLEKEMMVRSGTAEGRVLVLPEWRESRRYLRVTVAGTVEFVDV